MGLEIIGAGFGRTGTLSTKQALEILGFGPTHHMHEVTDTQGQREIWRAIAAGEPPDWDLTFANYRSMVDWPGSHYWRELSEYYPQAKVLLTVRSADSWFESVSKTIFPAISTSPDEDSVGVKLIREKIFSNRLDDRAHVIDIYERNIAAVQATIAPARLLLYSVADGWEPLCEFLNVPVPDQPFPRSNSTEQFNERMSDPNVNRS